MGGSYFRQLEDPPREYNGEIVKHGFASEWSKCAKAVREFDMGVVQSLRGDLDTLLVFASLFSAVVTAFLVDSYKSLKQDPADATLELLRHIVAQMAGSNQSPESAFLPPFTPSPSSIKINILWFTSLILSLNSVLMIILAKQWLSEYAWAVGTTVTSPRGRVAVRQLRLEALTRWRVPTIIDYMPLQLLFSLFLFLAGLVNLAWTLHYSLAILSSVLVAFSALFFFITAVIPSISHHSPYYSTQAWLVFQIATMARKILSPRTTKVYSADQAWTNVTLDGLARPSQALSYEARALKWIYSSISPWEPDVLLSLYKCAHNLPSEFAAGVYCDLYIGSADHSLPLYTEEHVVAWKNHLGWEIYFGVYETLLTALAVPPPFRGHEIGDLTKRLNVFCSLHLVWSLDYPGNIKSQRLFITGLLRLAEFTSVLSDFPEETRTIVTATLKKLADQTRLSRYCSPESGAEQDYFSLLNSLALCTLQTTPDPKSDNVIFHSLFTICFRLYVNGRLHKEFPVTLIENFKELLQSMCESLRSGFIYHSLDAWNDRFLQHRSSSGFPSIAVDLAPLADALVELRDRDLLAWKATQTINVDLISMLCTRRSSKVVCDIYIKSAEYSGDDMFSLSHVQQWSNQLVSTERKQILQCLLDDSPLVQMSSGPLHPRHMRILFSLIPAFTRGDTDLWCTHLNLLVRYLVQGLPSNSSGVAVDHADIAAVIADMVDNTSSSTGSKYLVILRNLIRAAMLEYPHTTATDLGLFPSLFSSALRFAGFVQFYDPKPIVYAELKALLRAATKCIRRICTDVAHDRAKGVVSGWMAILNKLIGSPIVRNDKQELLKKSVVELVEAARETGVGGDEVEKILYSQLFNSDQSADDVGVLPWGTEWVVSDSDSD